MICHQVVATVRSPAFAQASITLGWGGRMQDFPTSATGQRNRSEATCVEFTLPPRAGLTGLRVSAQHPSPASRPWEAGVTPSQAVPHVPTPKAKASEREREGGATGGRVAERTCGPRAERVIACWQTARPRKGEEAQRSSGFACMPSLSCGLWSYPRLVSGNRGGQDAAALFAELGARLFAAARSERRRTRSPSNTAIGLICQPPSSPSVPCCIVFSEDCGPSQRSLEIYDNGLLHVRPDMKRQPRIFSQGAPTPTSPLTSPTEDRKTGRQTDISSP